MTIRFDVDEAREFLLKNGFVYTLRPFVRMCGFDIAVSKGREIGLVWIEFIGEMSDDRLEKYVNMSGFSSVGEWKRKAKQSRYLYKVNLVKVIEAEGR